MRHIKKFKNFTFESIASTKWVEGKDFFNSLSHPIDINLLTELEKLKQKQIPGSDTLDFLKKVKSLGKFKDLGKYKSGVEEVPLGVVIHELLNHYDPQGLTDVNVDDIVDASDFKSVKVLTDFDY